MSRELISSLKTIILRDSSVNQYRFGSLETLYGESLLFIEFSKLFIAISLLFCFSYSFLLEYWLLRRSLLKNSF